MQGEHFLHEHVLLLDDDNPSVHAPTHTRRALLSDVDATTRRHTTHHPQQSSTHGSLNILYSLMRKDGTLGGKDDASIVIDGALLFSLRRQSSSFQMRGDDSQIRGGAGCATPS